MININFKFGYNFDYLYPGLINVKMFKPLYKCVVELRGSRKVVLLVKKAAVGRNL